MASVSIDGKVKGIRVKRREMEYVKKASTPLYSLRSSPFPKSRTL